MRKEALKFFTQLIKEKKPVTEAQRLINHIDLKIAEFAPYKVQIELITKDCCPTCNALDGKIITLEEAMATKPLPNISCTGEMGCYCLYAAAAARDDNDRIMRK